MNSIMTTPPPKIDACRIAQGDQEPLAAEYNIAKPMHAMLVTSRTSNQLI